MLYRKDTVCYTIATWKRFQVFFPSIPYFQAFSRKGRVLLKQQITIKDIAHMCNTSVSTVSRVLNGHPDVSEGLRRRVLETVAQNSYVPNNSARNLAKTRSDAIALILRGAENPFFNRLIKTATPAIYRRNYSCVLHQIPSDGDEIRAAAALARERRLQGILFFGGRFNYTPEEVALLQVPFVCCTYTNAFGCLDAAAYSSVTIDDTRAASRAVRELCTRGHRRIAALIVEKDDHSIGELRFRGYKAALQDQGIPYDPDLVECVHDFNMESAYQGTQRLIDRAGDFTALFALSDLMGMAAIKALYQRGKRVPADCSVIAIDGLEVSQYTIPTLTTMEQPAESLAEESVRILLDMIEGKAGNRHVIMSTRLRAGASIRSIEKSQE